MRQGSWTPSTPGTNPGSAIRRPAETLDAEFNKFLFATAAETNNGAVSVLSALARLDLDPWAEAAKLARLPRELAAHRLAGLIGPCAKETSPAQAPRTAAALVALLPRGAVLQAAQLATAGPDAAGPAIAHARSILAFLFIFVVAMFSVQCIARITAAQPRNPVHTTAPPVAWQTHIGR